MASFWDGNLQKDGIDKLLVSQAMNSTCRMNMHAETGGNDMNKTKEAIEDRGMPPSYEAANAIL